MISSVPFFWIQRNVSAEVDGIVPQPALVAFVADVVEQMASGFSLFFALCPQHNSGTGNKDAQAQTRCVGDSPLPAWKKGKAQ